MFILARFLLLERFRKLNLHYGWAGYTSACLALLILGWTGLNLAVSHVKYAAFELLEALLIALWTIWSLLAAFTGKDLSWRINRERILALTSPGFLQLYILSFILGFLSFPLLLFLLVVQYWAFHETGVGFESVLPVFTGYLLFVSSVRLSASLVRVVLYQVRYLPGSLKSLATLGTAFITAGTLAAMFHFGIQGVHPGHLFGLVLSGRKYWYPLVYLILWVALLGLADFLIQHNLTYSGIRGPLAPRNPMMRRCSKLLFHSAWPGPLFRVGILGWLRSRSALLLFVWGGVYSFLWTLYSEPDDVYYFFLFIWMNLLFHSYLRGNLLGTDRAGVWLYYMLPSRIDRALNSKSLSLSLLQSCMVASLLVAGFLRSNTILEIADWGRVLSYALSGIVFGEICGFFFSVKYPDPIDRKSQFDGGTTVGALIIPVLQILFLLLFILISGRVHMPAPYWGLLLAVPSLLLVARFVVLKTWFCGVMLEEREFILKRLEG
jgi:hypothetical protein